MDKIVYTNAYKEIWTIYQKVNKLVKDLGLLDDRIIEVDEEVKDITTISNSEIDALFD